jgi:2Fe-2S ferredoxin
MGITITFVQMDGVEKVIEDATPGESLMELAKANGVEGILGDCGGSCACATCHVYVDGASALPERGQMEAELLELSLHVRSNSRLSCQVPVAALNGARVTIAPED